MWRGIAHECALLLFSVSTDAKKNPNGRVRYPIKHDWNSAYGKTLSGTCRITPVYQDHVQGLDLEVGFCGIATRAVNWYLIRQMNQPHLPLSLYNIWLFYDNYLVTRRSHVLIVMMEILLDSSIQAKSRGLLT